MILIFITLVACAYLIGSIPFGLIFTKYVKGEDIRRIGSGNIGATNAKRAGGWKLGLAVLVADMAKGAICVLAAKHPWLQGLFPEDILAAALASAAVFGHIFPAYLKGEPGGKGVATTAGAFLFLAPKPFLVAACSFIICVAATRIVSLGSIIAAIILAAAAITINGISPTSVAASFCCILILLRHSSNIKRIMNGTEPRL